MLVSKLTSSIDNGKPVPKKQGPELQSAVEPKILDELDWFIVPVLDRLPFPTTVALFFDSTSPFT
jgi:hypothetical protein